MKIKFVLESLLVLVVVFGILISAAVTGFDLSERNIESACIKHQIFIVNNTKFICTIVKEEK